MNELQHDLGQIPQDPGTNAEIGVTMDKDDLEDSDSAGDSSESSDYESAEGEAPGSARSEEAVSDSDWITSDNFTQKLQEGLGLGSLRL